METVAYELQAEGISMLIMGDLYHSLFSELAAQRPRRTEVAFHTESGEVTMRLQEIWSNIGGIVPIVIDGIQVWTVEVAPMHELLTYMQISCLSDRKRTYNELLQVLKSAVGPGPYEGKLNRAAALPEDNEKRVRIVELVQTLIIMDACLSLLAEKWADWIEKLISGPINLDKPIAVRRLAGWTIRWMNRTAKFNTGASLSIC